MILKKKEKRNLPRLNCQTSTNVNYCQIIMPDILAPVKENIAIHCLKSRAKDKINQPNMYFLCALIRGMEI